MEVKFEAVTIDCFQIEAVVKHGSFASQIEMRNSVSHALRDKCVTSFHFRHFFKLYIIDLTPKLVYELILFTCQKNHND